MYFRTKAISETTFFRGDGVSLRQLVYIERQSNTVSFLLARIVVLVTYRRVAY